jgi:hypothetical protein
VQLHQCRDVEPVPFHHGMAPTPRPAVFRCTPQHVTITVWIIAVISCKVIGQALHNYLPDHTCICYVLTHTWCPLPMQCDMHYLDV